MRFKRFWFDDPDVAVAAASVPAGARPLWVTESRPLDGHESPRHQLVTTAWFSDREHLGRFDRALGRSRRPGPATRPTLAARELLLRGGDVLPGLTPYKHMALARRAEGLSPEEFSRRWAAHSGRAGGTVLPEVVRGQAYAQNHPLLSADGEPSDAPDNRYDAANLSDAINPYDAINEVWFAREDDLAARIKWFADHAMDSSDADLFGPRWFLAATEVEVQLPDSESDTPSASSGTRD